MKTNFNEVIDKSIEFGDVIVCENGSYLILDLGNVGGWRVAAINVDTLEYANGFNDLKTINNRDKVCMTSGKIKRIIKSKNLELREI